MDAPAERVFLREDEPSFVGREEEMQRLRSALACAADGERRLVFLHGPPGIGKTRTALELARDAETRGFEVHVGRSHEGSGAPPFGPWRQILRSLAAAREQGTLRLPADSSVADVLRLAPELARHFAPPAEPAALGSAESRFSQLDGVTQVLCGAAQTRPLLLVLDDLQWADEASLALLKFMARNVRQAPILIVATHGDLARTFDDEASRAIRRTASEAGAESVALGGLGREAILETLRRRLPSDALARWIDEVQRASTGNPLFVLEIARLLEQQSGERDPGIAQLAIPENLRDAVRMRIEARSASCRSLLRCASGIGASFTLALARRVTGLDAEELQHALQEAQRAELLRAEGEPGSFRFAHGVVREVVYALLPETERIGLHARIAEALEQRHEPSLRPLAAELAHHFAQATPALGVERALAHVQRAADEARELYAFPEELRHLRQALQLLADAGTPDPELRSSLLLRLGWALSSTDAPVEQVERTLGETIALARELGRVDRVAHAAVSSARYARLKGHTTYALDGPTRARVCERHIVALEEVLAEQSLEHPSLRGGALLTLAGLAKDAGKHERAQLILSEVLRDTDGSPDAELRANALIDAFPLTALHPLEERSRFATELVEVSRRSARKDLECFGLGAHAYLALVRGDRSALDVACGEIERLAAGHRLPRLASAAAMSRSLQALLDGDLERAERETQEAVRSLDAPPAEALAGLIPYQWWSSLLQGHVDRIPFGVETLAASFLPRGLSQLLGAHLRTEAGRPPTQSDRDLDYTALLADLPRDDVWLWAASVCAEQCAALGQRAQGEALLDLLLPHAEHGIAIGWVCVCTGSLARPLGVLASILGHWHECEQLVESSLAHAERLRSVTLRVWAQVDAARALRRHPAARLRGRGAELAVAALQSARDLALNGAEIRLKRS